MIHVSQIINHVYDYPRALQCATGHGVDFSQWFSFLITRQGEITHVYHPPGDDDEVVIIKKGLAAMFASRLHLESEIPSRLTADGWRYDVREFGHEGHHNATYHVRRKRDGHIFVKTREESDHPVKHASSNYTKTLYYDKSLGTIHTVHINESFKTMHKVADGFDPFENARPVKAVNDFSNIDVPEMSVLGSGKLLYLTRYKITSSPLKPSSLTKGKIHVDQVKRRKPKVNIADYKNYIVGNLTCMRSEPDKGSRRLSKCFNQLTDALKALPDDVIAELASTYLKDKPRLTKTFKDQNHVFDAIAVLDTDMSQRLLMDNVLNRSRPNTFLVQRMMLQIVVMEKPPTRLIINKLKMLCFYPEKSPFELREGETYHRLLLTIGVIARRLWEAGRKEEASNIVEKLEVKLGIHGNGTIAIATATV